MNDAPIGIFDSGVGGLTVARAILDQLPHESVLYIGDTLNSPYGPKPLAAVRAHALEVMDDLVDAGVKIIFNYSEALVQVPPDVTVHTSSPAVDLLYALYFYLT